MTTTELETETGGVPTALPMTDDDHLLAALLAAGAGDLLLALRRAGDWEGRALGAAGDAAAHAWLIAQLAAQRPDDAVLSEEGADPAERLGSRRVWVIDPLDGTREYSERRSDWAVHVALTEDGVPTAAAVALPGLDVTYSTAQDGLPAAPTSAIAAAPPGRLRIAVSRSRPPEIARRVAELLGAELVPMGSAGYKTMAVLRGEVDAYLHAGGQYEWDSAAPVGVALRAGLTATRLDGSALRYNRPDPLLPDLVVSHSAISARLRAALDAAEEGA